MVRGGRSRRAYRSALCAVGWLCALVAVLAGPTGTAGVGPRSGPSRLRLKAGDVELTGGPQSLRSPRRAVIQFTTPLNDGQREQLFRLDARLGEYLPDNGYVADLRGVDLAALRSLPFVQGVSSFEPDWKRSTEFGRTAVRSAERKALHDAGRERVVVYLFSDADAAATIRRLNSRGGTVRDAQVSGKHSQLEVELGLADVAGLLSDEDVMFVEPAPEAEPRNATTAWISQSNTAGSTPYWDAGLHGEGQMAGIIDWDLRHDHCAFHDPSNPIGPLHRKLQAYYGMNPTPGPLGVHGTHVGGVLAGEAPGQSDPNFRGMAYNARLVFTNLPNLLTSTNLGTLLTTAHGDGARVHSNSWGNSQTTYNAWARDIDVFTHDNEDDLVLVATDNSGGVKAPENAKNCIAVAAAGDTPNQANFCFGAFGPTADGRRKPDLMTVGCGSISADVNQPCGLTSPTGGTSYATPAAAGLALLARQYFTTGHYPTGAAQVQDAFTPSGALLKAVMVNSAVDMTGIGGYPSMTEGWGRVLLTQTLHLAGGPRKLYVQDVRHSSGLGQGGSGTHSLRVLGNAEPLKVTLAWSDAPAAPAASFTPVNNLDLEVFAPGPTTYKGNVFSGGVSVSGGSADPLNNVEHVHLPSPTPGLYTIHVSGTNVPEGPQGYAIVVSGNVVPIDCASVLPGDVNLDGLRDGRDVGDFATLVLGGPFAVTRAAHCAADVGSGGNACLPDGQVDLDDLPGFVSLLLAGSCP